jgi:hypothetical protein
MLMPMMGIGEMAVGVLEDLVHMDVRVGLLAPIVAVAPSSHSQLTPRGQTMRCRPTRTRPDNSTARPNPEPK